MFDCFKKAPKPEIKEPAKPINTVGPSDNTPLAFVVGHNERSKGATNYLGESEWVFNSRIARKAQNKLAELGIRTAILFRPTGKGYSSQVRSIKKQAARINAKYAFCMHFNAASSSKATGCEVLIRNTRATEDERVADYMTDLLNERMGFKERHDDGIKVLHSGHNGYGMLKGLYDVDCLAVLLEPCFAKNRKQASKIFENEDAYVDIVVESALKLVTGKLPKM